MIGVAMLVALNLAVQYAKRILGYESLLGLVRLFTLNQETNLPTWFSALLLLTAALLLLLVAVLKQARAARFTRHWFGLAFIFFYLATDEAAEIHGLFNVVGATIGSSSGLFYWPWVTVALGSVLIVALAYLRFVAELPPKTRWLFVGAGVLYVFGAVGMEMLGGLYTETYGEESFTYALLFTIEETLEMTGVVLFLYALLDYLQTAGAVLTWGSVLPAEETNEGRVSFAAPSSPRPMAALHPTADRRPASHRRPAATGLATRSRALDGRIFVRDTSRPCGCTPGASFASFTRVSCRTFTQT